MWSMHGISDWASSRHRCHRSLFALSLFRTHCHCLNISLMVDQTLVHRSYYSCCLFDRHSWFYSNRKNSWSAPFASAATVHGASDSFANCYRSLSLLDEKWNYGKILLRCHVCVHALDRWSLPDGNLTGTPIFNWLIRSNAMRCKFFRSTSFNSCKWVFFRCKYLPVADFQMQLP